PAQEVEKPGIPAPACTASTCSVTLCGQTRAENSVSLALNDPGANTRSTLPFTGWAQTMNGSATLSTKCEVPPGPITTVDLGPLWDAARPTWWPLPLSNDTPG